MIKQRSTKEDGHNTGTLKAGTLDDLATTMPPETTLEQMTDIFAALGDGTRLRILYALSVRELCVDDLSTIVGITPSAVSHQLRHLRTLRLVRKRRQGRHAFYSLDDHHVLHIIREGKEHVEHD